MAIAIAGAPPVSSADSGWLHDASRAIRRLPPLWVRLLMALDFFLCVFVPPWTYFWFCRWTGKLLSPREFSKLLGTGIRFAWAHVKHTGEGTGALNVDWSSPPVRSCQTKERSEHFPRGSCGTCKNCCTTGWLPEGKRLACPFLGEGGCTIYGGIYWDYFNCGRYPATPAAVSHYSCPRFEGLLTGAPRAALRASSEATASRPLPELETPSEKKRRALALV
ncbi:hypothetical protein HY251_16360 [bacterium]|nr:hypothetical protein [bacterium]